MVVFLLLHNPWVQFYLAYVAALSVVVLWDSLRPHPATQDGARTPPNEAAHGGTSLSPRLRKRESSAVGVGAGKADG